MSTARRTANVSRLWPIRAVQLDLARQMETVPYIKRYTDFVAGVGFNTLVLYLEARVRTTAFPYRPAKLSYTLDDMAEVVAHAAKAGVEVIPVVSTYGHAEQFLACPELHGIAEEREGFGRWGKCGKSTFCPSKDETYEFLESYIGEICGVFTSEHFHVGLDEIWNMGQCPLCRKRWKSEGLDAVFTQHVKRTHAILQKFGKRAWMWDDMFEWLTQALPEIPRDIVQCHWNYSDIVETAGSRAHFVNCWRKDWLAEYERRGIDAVIAPWAINPRNVETFTAYARRHRVLGGLLTQWEGSPRYLPENDVAITFAGHLWNQPGVPAAAAWERTLTEQLGAKVPALTRTAVQALGGLHLNRPAGWLQLYLKGPLAQEEYLQRTATGLALTMLRAAPAPAAAAPRQLLNGLEIGTVMDQLHWDLRELLPAIADPQRRAAETADLRRRAAAWRTAYRAAVRRYAAWLRAAGHAHPTDDTLARLRRLEENIKPMWAMLARQPDRNDWLATLRLFLQDYYGSPRLRLTLLTAKGEQVIFDGNAKPPNHVVAGRIGGQYDVQVPFRCSARPLSLRIEAGGHGGQGIGFIELRSPQRCLVPRKLLKTHGPVTRAEAVLVDDSSYAYLGNPDIRTALYDPAVAGRLGLLELALNPQS